MATRELRDVIVVGGGPAGAATATFLRQRGHDVLVLDEARFPRDKVCGEGISPEAWPLLAELGVEPDVRALHPYPLRGMTLYSPDGTRVQGSYVGSKRLGFAARRITFDETLLRRAGRAGADVVEGARVTDVVCEHGVVGGVVVAAHEGTPVRLRARLVVAADGRRSIVARRLGLLGEHPRLRKFAVRGYFDGMEGLEEYGEMHVAAGGYCGVAPHSPTCANVAFVLDHRDMKGAGGDIEGFYMTALNRWPRLVERLRHATLLGRPRAVGPLALVAKRVSAPGLLLVGDAAGFYDPFTGEGVTLALRSAEMAARVADQALRLDSTEDLGEYDRIRHAATEAKFRFNRLVQVLVGRPWLADLMGHRLARRPDLADRLVGIAGDFIPARSALGLRFLAGLIRG